MLEVYTCVCGGEQFSIKDSTITCWSCGRFYTLLFKTEIESPEDFNSRIRSEKKE